MWWWWCQPDRGTSTQKCILYIYICAWCTLERIYCKLARGDTLAQYTLEFESHTNTIRRSIKKIKWVKSTRIHTVNNNRYLNSNTSNTIHFIRVYIARMRTRKYTIMSFTIYTLSVYLYRIIFRAMRCFIIAPCCILTAPVKKNNKKFNVFSSAHTSCVHISHTYVCLKPFPAHAA